MPTPVPVSAESTGLPDSTWITDVRDGLRDYPKYTTETWTGDGSNGVVSVTGAPLTVAKPPINISGDIQTGISSLSVRNNSIGQNYTVVTSGTPSSTQVLVDHNTGEIRWASAPAMGNVIQLSYQYCRWTDASITTALYSGLRLMFPRVFRIYTDIEIPIVVNQWDYQLPVWCQTPGSRLTSIEIADPYIPTEPFRPAPAGVRRIGLANLHIPWAQAYSPTARLRVSGIGPYLALGDLEPQLYHLPVWYALSVLLTKQEAKRIREDTLLPLAQTGGQQPTLHLQTGDYYARRFEQELDFQKRVMGPQPALPMATTYQAGYMRHRR